MKERELTNAECAWGWFVYVVLSYPLYWLFLKYADPFHWRQQQGDHFGIMLLGAPVMLPFHACCAALKKAIDFCSWITAATL